MGLSIVILAAGKGTRMRSALPKVLHPVGERALLEHVIDTAKGLGAEEICVVYGHGGEIVPQTLAACNVNWVLQDQQLGTGHAVAQALPHIKTGNDVLVLYGDVPLTAQHTLTQLMAEYQRTGFGLLTVTLDDPTGYGRIVRDGAAKVASIVEHKDASSDELAICEVNTGILAASRDKLEAWLSNLNNNNAQGEYYLTDAIAMAVKDGLEVATSQPDAEYEVLGVNNKRQLAILERHYQQLKAESLMDAGVTLRDPARIDVRGNLECGQDVEIDVNVVFEGVVTIGEGTKIGANCVIRNSTIGAGVTILENTVIDQAIVGNDSKVGPFARLRPETELATATHIGNFVEIKKAQIGHGSKVNHLSYVGDASVGKNVNIGAGTITCNYDGANKYLTEIGNDVFVGSDTQLIAPVKVGDGATIGAGSTITKEVASGVLALSRSKQTTIENWQRPTKKHK